MAQRNIIECDRCHREIRNKSGVTTISHQDRKIDLCEMCNDKLARFMAGEDLEVPPLAKQSFRFTNLAYKCGCQGDCILEHSYHIDEMMLCPYWTVE